MGLIKQFIIQSKVLEITIGMIVAVAFERMISSLVSGILMPLLQVLTKQMMGDYKIILVGAKAYASPDKLVAIQYGRLIEAVIVFLIILYFIAKGIKIVEVHRKKESLKPKVTPTEPDQIYLEENIG